MGEGKKRAKNGREGDISRIVTNITNEIATWCPFFFLFNYLDDVIYNKNIILFL